MPRARHRSMQSTSGTFPLSPMSGWLHEHLPEMITPWWVGCSKSGNYQLYFTQTLGPASGQALSLLLLSCLTLGPHNPGQKRC